VEEYATMREYPDGKLVTDEQAALVDWVGENINPLAKASLECVLMDGLKRFVGVSPLDVETICIRAKELKAFLPI